MGTISSVTTLILGVATITGTLLLTPQIWSLFNSLVFRLLVKRDNSISLEEKRLQLKPYHAIIAYFHALVMWCIVGTGLYLIIDTMMPLQIKMLPQIISIFSFSCALGMAAVIVPSGLGVREGALIFLLGNILLPPWPSIVAIVARLSWIAAELCNFCIGLVIHRKIVEKKIVGDLELICRTKQN